MRPLPEDPNFLIRCSFEDLIGLRCAGCGAGLTIAFVCGTSIDARCKRSISCSRLHLYRVCSRPAWAESNSNTYVDTETGERRVELIPVEPTVEQIDTERGTMLARLHPNGWTRCPHCGVSFATYSRASWQDGRHARCRTKLELLADTDA